MLISALCVNQASAQSNSPYLSAEEETKWSVHGQFTLVQQRYAGFNAKYTGANSFSPAKSSATTRDITLYLGAPLWSGAELYLNPELDQGFGLSNTVGAAGYPSGEAYKVGASNPYGRLPRAFIRQTFNLGGESLTLADGPNQIEKKILPITSH